MNTDQRQPNYHYLLVKLTTETHDLLEDFRHLEQKRQHRRITKREVIERAVAEFVSRATSDR